MRTTLRACERLREEHALIARVVTALESLATHRASRAEAVMLPVQAAVDFFTGFVARCHDVKEQEAFFPVLSAHGADGALIEALHEQHDEGDRLLRALTSHRIEPPAWDLLEAYLGLLRRHIETEDGELLPLAEKLLSPEEDAGIERAFLGIEERTLGPGGSGALLALAAAVARASDALAAETAGTGAPLVARQIMRPRAGTVAPDDSLARAAALMESLRTRELCVVAGAALVGIVTRSDMEPHRGHYEWTAVRAAMTPDPVCVAPDTPVPDVARLLVERAFNAVPVTEGARLVGIVARSDVLRMLAGERS